MKNLLIAQSGGPTSAINSSLAGIVEHALTRGEIGKIYGGINGIKGIIDEHIEEIGPMLSSTADLALLSATPGSALKTCRYKLDNKPETFARIFSVFEKFNIGWFIYIGGNDSMDTVVKLSKYAKSVNSDVIVMGVPKTIDNDLCVTDHSPGFGSAAKFVASTMAEMIRDLSGYDIKQVVIVEIMGRNAGWLTSAAALAGLNGGGTPHLIYLPEVAFDEDEFISDVTEQLSKTPYVVVAISEGIKDKNNVYICEKESERGIDNFNHKMLQGAGKYLEKLVTQKIGCKVRTVDYSLLQRCSGHLASACDIEESRMLGSAALRRALEGVSGEMPYIERISDKPYKIRIKFTDAANIANHEKTVPLDFLNERRNNVNQKMIDYLYPLIQGERLIQYENGIPKHFMI